jgi:hypothetical protein
VSGTAPAEIWFGAKSLYRWPEAYARTAASGAGRFVYEERIVLLRARDATDALARADAEARAYAESDDGITYIRLVGVYELFDALGDGAEVYSLLRTTPLAPEVFLHRCHDEAEMHGRRDGGHPPADES